MSAMIPPPKRNPYFYELEILIDYLKGNTISTRTR